MGFYGLGFSLVFRVLDTKVSRIVSAIRNHEFALAAFLLPFTVRTIPEVMAGPYPIGFDIIAFYVPKTLDMAAGSMRIWVVLGSGLLMDSFVVPLYILTINNPL